MILKIQARDVKAGQHKVKGKQGNWLQVEEVVLYERGGIEAEDVELVFWKLEDGSTHICNPDEGVWIQQSNVPTWMMGMSKPSWGG